MDLIEKYLKKNDYEKIIGYISLKKKDELKSLLNLKMKGQPLLFRVKMKEFDSRIIDYLVDNGLDISDTEDIYGSNLLMKSIEDENEVLFLYLLRTKIDLDKQDKRGQTVLHYASYNLDKKYVDILIKFGANPNIQDIHGCTAWMMIGYGICNLLLTKEDKNKKQKEVINIFFNTDINISLKDKNDNTFSDIIDTYNKNLVNYFIHEHLKNELSK